MRFFVARHSAPVTRATSICPARIASAAELMNFCVEVPLSPE
jgi:hypothetical protein